MSVKINNSAGGSVTLDSTTTSNEALTLPTGGGTLAKTTDIPTAGADTSLSNLTATGEQRVAQAWVNFNGTGTVAIRDDYNVSSITDKGTGKYAINFSTALADANYACACTCGISPTDVSNRFASVVPSTSSVAEANTRRSSDGSYQDVAFTTVIVLGN